MKIITKDFHISTRNHCEFVDITSEVASAVSKSGVKEGDAIIYCPHTTAGITINENADPSVTHDILLTLGGIDSASSRGLSARRGQFRCSLQKLACRLQRNSFDKGWPIGSWDLAGDILLRI